MTRHDVVTPGRDMRERSAAAVADPVLQEGLRNVEGIRLLARWATGALGDLRTQAALIRRETIAELDGWIDQLEVSLTRNGATVHRAATPDDACTAVLDIARQAGAQRIVKSQSMATEEIELNDALEAAGMSVVETDLGEYIIQLAGERPSHMIGPALHKPLSEVRDILSREAGVELPLDREALCAWARVHLREEFLSADVGITGVNFAAADTGTLVLVTNEGNGRLCTTWPRVHVAVMAVEKVVPRFSDLAVLLPLLTTTATGQKLSTYLSMITGPRTEGELDGPEELHVVIVDHNRRSLVGTPYEEMLACLRCAACLNVCPVYGKVSGHAYDAVYSGPLGKILTPLLSAGDEGCDLPHASTLCGACSEACPVGIPLADMIVRLRGDLRAPAPFTPARSYPPANAAPLPAGRSRTRSARGVTLRAWARIWSSPVGYRISTKAAGRGVRMAARLSLGAAALRSALRPGSGSSAPPPDGAWMRRLPGAGAWTQSRDLPLPPALSFRDRWERRADRGDRW